MFGLALSGGGIKGFAHIGILKGLKAHGIRPNWISGSSAGAVIAALYAIGYSPNDIEKIAYSSYRGLIDLNYLGFIKGAVQFAIGTEISLDGLIKGNRIETLLEELTDGRTMREVNIPLAITAVDINDGRTIIFVSNRNRMDEVKGVEYREEVKISSAVRASISIPVIFRPKIIDGVRLVDGGVTDNLPVYILRKMGARNVLGIYLGYCGERRAEVDNIFEIASQTLDIMAYHITRSKSAGADIILRPNISDLSSKTLHRGAIDEYIKRGYMAIDDNIDMIKEAIKL